MRAIHHYKSRIRLHRTPINLLMPSGILVSIIAVFIIRNMLNPADATSSNVTYQLMPVATELESPTYLTHADDSRLFIVERRGVVLILDDGVVLPEPFLDLEDQVESSENIEQGMTNITFAPDYSETGIFYVRYIDLEGDNVLARYQTSSNDPNRADAASAEILLEVEQSRPLHVGGYLEFGPDGYLYATFGDGGDLRAPMRIDNLLGKILRIDVSGDTGYTIPNDNPFLDEADARPEIWAYGLRNPWRLSFDPVTDDLYIADVGESSREEVNYLPAGDRGGHNFGWPYFQGFFRDFFEREIEVDSSGMTFPVFQYEHTGGSERSGLCAIIGGSVYRGEALTELQGTYLYGDWCGGIIWSLEQQNDEWVNTEILQLQQQINSFGVDHSGEVYVMTFSGDVFKLVQDP